ncbi:BrxA/BrxB family bacilliredoxin [soil metagenome]
MALISIKSLMSNSAPSYSPEVAKPFREELTAVGFTELLTVADVDAALNIQNDKTTLLVLNSVCGCAAGKARPGVILSMANEVIPDEYVTLFAGMEKEAVSYFREKYLPGLTATSPNIAVFKNGQLIHILHRYMIEGNSAVEIAQELSAVYDKVCSKRNLPEEIDKLKII